MLTLCLHTYLELKRHPHPTPLSHIYFVRFLVTILITLSALPISNPLLTLPPSIPVVPDASVTSSEHESLFTMLSCGWTNGLLITATSVACEDLLTSDRATPSCVNKSYGGSVSAVRLPVRFWLESGSGQTSSGSCGPSVTRGGGGVSSAGTRRMALLHMGHTLRISSHFSRHLTRRRKRGHMD